MMPQLDADNKPRIGPLPIAQTSTRRISSPTAATGTHGLGYSQRARREEGPSYAPTWWPNTHLPADGYRDVHITSAACEGGNITPIYPRAIRTITRKHLVDMEGSVCEDQAHCG